MQKLITTSPDEQGCEYINTEKLYLTVYKLSTISIGQLFTIKANSQ